MSAFRRTTSTLAWLASAALVGAVLVPTPAHAGPPGPGTGDPRFTPTTAATGVPAGTNQAFARPVVAPDGSTVLVGRVDGRSRILRFTPGGALDPSFAAAGVFAGGALTGLGSTLTIADVALVPTSAAAAGSTVFVGDVDGGIPVIGRLDPAGVLDPAFGGVGYRVLSSVTPGYSAIGLRAVQVEDDGTITTIGVERAGSGDENLLVGRLAANGDALPGGGSGGQAAVGSAAAGTYRVEDVTRTDPVAGAPAGAARTVAAGSMTPLGGGPTSAFVVALDGFGDPAFSVTDLDGAAGTGDEITAVAPAGPGRIAVAGTVNGETVVGRYSVDDLFGTASKIPLDGPDTLAGLRLIPSSTLVAPTGLDRDDQGSLYLLGRIPPGGFAPGDTRMLRLDDQGRQEFRDGLPWLSDLGLTAGSGTYLNTLPAVVAATGGTLVVTGGSVTGTPPVRPYLDRYLARTSALSVSVTAPSSIGVGQSFVATATASNASADAAPAVVVLSWPAGVSPIGPAPGCTLAAGGARCTLGTVAARGARAVAITLRRDSDVALGLGARVEGGYFDTSTSADDSASTALVGQAYAFGRPGSECGARASRPCTIKRGTKRSVTTRLAVTSVLPVPAGAARVTVQVQRKVGKRWVRLSRPAVRAGFAGTSASVTWPKALRAKRAVYRARVVVPAADGSAPATTSWRYLRVR